jgi:hypothetical protein
MKNHETSDTATARAAFGSVFRIRSDSAATASLMRKWQQSQNTDGSGGSRNARLVLTSKFLKWPQGDVSNRPALVADCMSGKVSHKPEGKFVAGP